MENGTHRNKSVSLRKQLDCYTVIRIMKKTAERSVNIFNLQLMKGMIHHKGERKPTIKGKKITY